MGLYQTAVILVHMKKCASCNTQKNRSEFYPDKRVADGLRRYCKDCVKVKARAWSKANWGRRRIQRHGLSLRQYEEILSKQGGRCATCDSVGSLTIDHDHKCCPQEYSCGKCVRGILCSKCNAALGQVNDDVKVLKKMVEYLGS